MKRFIDIGHQMHLGDSEPKQFAFYCTAKDTFERFSNKDIWETASGFAYDYTLSGGNELERYLNLIPDEFK
jgi:hypothetical protein